MKEKINTLNHVQNSDIMTTQKTLPLNEVRTPISPESVQSIEMMLDTYSGELFMRKYDETLLTMLAHCAGVLNGDQRKELQFMIKTVRNIIKTLGHLDYIVLTENVDMWVTCPENGYDYAKPAPDAE